jgi:hypothetical protein
VVVIGLAGLLVAAVGILVFQVWPEPTLVGRSESVTLVVEPGRTCNISLSPGDRNRHGLTWFTYGTWPAAADQASTHAGRLTYTANDEASVESDGVTVRFKGYGPKDFPDATCPLNSTDAVMTERLATSSPRSGFLQSSRERRPCDPSECNLSATLFVVVGVGAAAQ